MGYRIGKIEGEFIRGYNFVINKEGEDLVFYAHNTDSNYNPDYPEIEKKFGLENIVGRGVIDHASGGPSVLGIWSGPIDNLGVKFDMVDNFKWLIFRKFKEKNPELRKVINMCPGASRNYRAEEEEIISNS